MYRVEKKYLCSDYELLLLKQRLSAVLQRDSHQRKDYYRVRSVYLDTYDDACFYGNEDGVDERQKYRIRTYPGADERLRFEIKEKKSGKTKKDAFPVTKEECREILDGCPIAFSFEREMEDAAAAARNRAALLARTELLRPVIIVDYERSAYVYPIGNVRITFDRNITASARVGDFFAENPAACPILPEHTHLLEVKYDELLPDFIGKLLNLGNMQRVTFSKYAICRQMVENGKRLVY